MKGDFMMLACHTTETNHCLLEGWKVFHAESWLSPGAAGWGLSEKIWASGAFPWGAVVGCTDTQQDW